MQQLHHDGPNSKTREVRDPTDLSKAQPRVNVA